MEIRIITTGRFLVPIDFSEYADYALDYAIALAQKLGGRLILLHVIQPVPMAGVDLGIPVPYPYLEAVEAEIAGGMESRLQRVQAAGVAGETMVMHGVPVHEIVATATRQRTDLIILGTHGRSGFFHMLLGSVAENVVRLAPCPVLVARQRQSNAT